MSHNTQEEIRIKDDLDNSVSSLQSSKGGKKRKKEKRRSPLEDSALSSLGDSLTESLESRADNDKCKSPNSKKLKLTNGDNNVTKPVNDVIDTQDNSSKLDEALNITKSKRLGSKEKDIINYLNENFSESPSIDTNNVKSDQVKTDADYFKAIPVAVRQPLKIPKHASNILSSRHVTEEAKEDAEDRVKDDNDEADDSDVECSALSDDSDSELESLVR